VPGERQLRAGCEDPHPVVGVCRRRRHHERRLGQVHPPGDALHLLGGQTVAVEHDGDRVAEIRRVGEHVDHAELAHDQGVY
jgi:hypothetical protein